MKAQVLHKYDPEMKEKVWVTGEELPNPKIEKASDVIVKIGAAFPPFFRILSASSVASGCEVAAIAFAEIESEFLLDFINKFYRINLI